MPLELEREMISVARCNKCGGDSGVYDSRERGAYWIRQRKCGECGERWSTAEIRTTGELADTLNQITKSVYVLSKLIPIPTRRLRRKEPQDIVENEDPDTISSPEDLSLDCHEDSGVA